MESLSTEDVLERFTTDAAGDHIVEGETGIESTVHPSQLVSSLGGSQGVREQCEQTGVHWKEEVV